jgi:hypothetical protein
MRLLFPFAALAFVAAALAGCGSDDAIEYQVRISFNETVTQADLDETAEILRAYDEDVDYLIQESFPPTGVATLSTDEPDFCATIVAELEAKPYVSSVDCTKTADLPPTSENPDEPVSSEPVTSEPGATPGDAGE